MVIDRISEGLNGPPKLSGLILTLVNMIPVIGIILWEWNVYQIASLYWAEILIFGFLNIAKMVVAAGAKDNTSRIAALSMPLLIVFFIGHFGAFFFAHGFIVNTLLGEGQLTDNWFTAIGTQFAEVGKAMWGAFLLLALSHIFAFFWSYIGQREYRETTARIQMFRPYKRLVIMQLIILFAALAIQILEEPIVLTIGLVALKTSLDFGFHLYYHVLDAAEQHMDESSSFAT